MSKSNISCNGEQVKRSIIDRLFKLIESEDSQIDSLKIRIPYCLIDIKCPNLLSTSIRINESNGEAIDGTRKAPNSLIYDPYEAFKTIYRIEQLKIRFNGSSEKFVTIGLHSKQLGHRYFEGITKETIGYLFEYILGQNIISINNENFLKSECTDIDFKIDYSCSVELFSNHIKDIKALSKETRIKEKGYRAFNEKLNKGIEFSKRETTSFIGNPFFKCYHKEVELLSESIDFKNAYLSGISIRDKARMETTIKNKKHLKYHNVQNNRLNDILAIDPETKKNFFKKAIQSHLNTDIQIRRNKSFNTNDNMVIGMSMIRNKKATFDDYKAIVSSLCDPMSKVQKCRLNKKLEKFKYLFNPYL